MFVSQDAMIQDESINRCCKGRTPSPPNRNRSPCGSFFCLVDGREETPRGSTRARSARERRSYATTTPRHARDHGFGIAHGEGEHILGPRPNTRRTRQSRSRHRTEYGPEHGEGTWYRPGTGARKAHLVGAQDRS